MPNGNPIPRRAFLAGAAGIAAAGLVSPRVARALSVGASPAELPGLPSRARVQGWIDEMLAPGPRFTANASHNHYVDFLADGFEQLGLKVNRDRHTFTRWLAKDFSLQILSGSKKGSVPVAAYYSYSGPTPKAGVTGQLVYAGVVPPPSLPGSPLNIAAYSAAAQDSIGEVNADIARRLANVAGGVKGKIVLMDVVIPPIPFGALYPDATYVYDPAGTLPMDDYKRAALLLGTVPNLAPFEQAGVAGVVFSLDASWANAEGQYAPFIYALQKTPSLLVDRDTGKTLRAAAADGARARLTLTADVTPKTRTDTLWTMVPGQTNEVMIVNTHTDGPNAIEENGGVALLALAHHFAKLRLQRSIAFVCVTGHFSADVPSTPGWIAAHQDLVGRAASALCIEHFGAREWVDDPVKGYRSTGLVEPSLIFHSQTPIVAYAASSIADRGIDRSALLRPAGISFFGEGAPLHESGVPTLGFVPGPNYLLSWADDQHRDKLDMRVFYKQLGWAADLIHRLDAIPAGLLKAGDSAVLPHQLGGTLPIE